MYPKTYFSVDPVNNGSPVPDLSISQAFHAVRNAQIPTPLNTLNTTQYSQYYSILSILHNTAVVLNWFISQVAISLHGPDIPVGSTISDLNRRRKIFEIAAPYVLSAGDIETVKATPQNLVDLWLSTFTSSLKGIFLNLYSQTKNVARQSYCPRSGMIPAEAHAKLVGLPPGKTILDRKVQVHYSSRATSSSIV
jgi:hypothetical protein